VPGPEPELVRGPGDPPKSNESKSEAPKAEVRFWPYS
jgi:hypothetical protein